MNPKVEELKKLIAASENVVFFGGAGVSTESGIPDFRSKDGLYNQKYDYPPETILSAQFFKHHTEEFFKFYRDKLNVLNFSPNIVHEKLAELEQAKKLSAIITQNIDGLHEKAGSSNVRNLHGTINRNYCTKCGKQFDANYVFNQTTGIPMCDEDDCNGIVKPDVVLYGERLNDCLLQLAAWDIDAADLLIVGGTSLLVHPACGFVDRFINNRQQNPNLKLVIINLQETEYDRQADLVIYDKLGNVFQEL